VLFCFVLRKQDRGLMSAVNPGSLSACCLLYTMPMRFSSLVPALSQNDFQAVLSLAVQTCTLIGGMGSAIVSRRSRCRVARLFVYCAACVICYVGVLLSFSWLDCSLLMLPVSDADHCLINCQDRPVRGSVRYARISHAHSGRVQHLGIGVCQLCLFRQLLLPCLGH
jgi:hypothetical protein